MTTTFLTIPDVPAEWRDLLTSNWTGEWPTQWPALSVWLDQQLIGLHLAQLVEALQILQRVHNEQSAEKQDPPDTMQKMQRQALDQILDKDQRKRVRNEGTSVLRQTEIQGLFRSPETLLDLQEDILINGGKYWRTVQQTPEHQQLAKSGFEKIRAKIAADTQTESGSVAAAEKHSAPATAKPSRKLQRGVVAAAVLAMSILITLAVLRPGFGPKISGEGFGTPGLFTNDVNSPAEYLQRMAQANEKWLTLPRKDREALLTALYAYSDDCKIVIASNHPALPKDYERWLKGKCADWKGKIDNVIVALAANEMSFEEATMAANQIVETLADKLNKGPTAEELKQMA